MFCRRTSSDYTSVVVLLRPTARVARHPIRQLQVDEAVLRLPSRLLLELLDRERALAVRRRAQRMATRRPEVEGGAVVDDL